MEQLTKNAIDFVSTYGGKMILALLVFLIGRLVMNALNKAAGKAIDKTSLDGTVNRLRKTPSRFCCT